MKNKQINAYDEPLEPSIANFLIGCFTIFVAVILGLMTPFLR